MTGLHIQFLGDLKVIRDGVEQRLPPSKKTRGLLAYLALNTKAFRREQLCELLWEVPDDPRGSLRWSLSKLRKLVDEPDQSRIVANRTHVSFEPGSANIDIVGLFGMLDQPVESLSLEALIKAASQYDGVFLEGLELESFHSFYAWCLGQREKICRSQIQLNRIIVDRLSNEPEQALEYAQRLVELAPYEESAYQEVVTILVRLGRRTEAKQQLDMAKRVLRDAGVTYSVDFGLGVTAQPDSKAVSSNDQTSIASTRAVGETPLPGIYGRELEISALHGFFRESCDSSASRFILLKGEPGIGKSCLLQVGRDLAEQAGGCYLSAAAFESEIVRPFALWIDALRRSDTFSLPELLNGETQVERDLLFSTLNELIVEEVSRCPVVLVFDDLQWCDESSLAALHYVLRMNRDRPVYVIAGAREVESRSNVAMQQALRGLRNDGILRELKLGPLGEEALCQLISEQAPEADAQRLGTECEGNPLLAIELARAESAGDSLGTLGELVRERISRLAPEAVDAVLWASVLAPHIAYRSLERVSGLDSSQLEQAIDNAVSHGMFVQTPQGFRFSHDMICTSVYEEISESRRQIMHRRIAEQLEVDTELDLQLAADLAHHASRSGDSGLAARAMVSAGRLCLRFYANEDALNLAATGLEYAGLLQDSERVCLTLELSDIRVAAGPVADWEAAAEEYAALAEEALDHGALPHARLGYQLASTLRWIHGHWVGARRDTLQAERVSRGSSDEEQILGLAETAKCLALLERDLSQADAMLMEAKSLAARRRIVHPSIHEGAGILRYYEGKFDQAEELLEEARTLCKSRGDRFSEFLANEYLLMIDLERSDLTGAARHGRAMLHIGEKYREGSELPFAKAILGLLQYIDDGESSELVQSLEALRVVDAKHRLAYVLNRLALIDLENRNFEHARVYATEALSCLEKMARPSESMMAHIALARSCEGLGDRSGMNKHIAALRSMNALDVARWAMAKAQPLLNKKPGKGL